MSSQSSHIPARRARPRAAGGDLLIPALGWASAAALAVGFAVREERYLSAEWGLGYALGIFGLGLMGLALAYPLSKRLPWIRGPIPMRAWFQLHMALGILGPLAIAFHANFRLGSLNSSVAFVAMSLVAGSGFVGRFLYTRIHRGLLGYQQLLDEQRRDADVAWGNLRSILELDPDIERQLRAFEAGILDGGLSLPRAAVRLVRVSGRSRRLERRLLARLRRAFARAGARREPVAVSFAFAEVALCSYIDAVRRVVRARGYERLFSLWHALHVPLCVLLFGGAAMHVIAVHAY